jgi:hypothetical protein
MDKLKEKLHIGSSRRKSQPDTDSAFTKESSTTHSTTFDNTPGAHSGGVGTIERTSSMHSQSCASTFHIRPRSPAPYHPGFSRLTPRREP